MNPENPSRPEIEAKLTALLLGELPEEEARLLRYTIGQDAELKKLHDRLKFTIGLVREVQAKPTETAPLKLSDERRRKLMAHFKTPRPKESFLVKPMKLSFSRVVTALAVVAMLALVARMIIPNFVKARSTSPQAALLNQQRMLALQKQVDREESLAPAATPPTQSNGAAASGGVYSQNVVGYVNLAVNSAPPAPAPPEPITSPPAVIVLPNGGSKDNPDLAEGSQEIQTTSGRQTQVRGTPKLTAISGVSLDENQAAAPMNNNQALTRSAESPAPGAAPIVAPPPGNYNIALPQIASDANGDARTAVNYAYRLRTDGITGAGGVTGVVNAYSGSGGGGGGFGGSSSVSSSAREPLGQFPGTSTAATAAGTGTTETLAFDDTAKYPAEKPASDRFDRDVVYATNGVPYLGDIPATGKLMDSHGTTFANSSNGLQPGQSDTFAMDRSQPATLTQDGKFLYEMGKLDEAKDKLQEALAINPSNSGALYYLNLANQAQYKASLQNSAKTKMAAISEPDAALRQAAPNVPIPQPEMLVKENAFSTFSLNVSDVSFQLAAASLAKGRLPEAVSIRSEEFINAFDYRDPEPAGGQRIAFNAERAHDPFAHNRDYLRFSLKTAATGRQPGRPLNLVLLLDDSGSMERADRVAIIREALRILATQLQPQDTLSIVTFARTAHLWADGVPGDQAGAVLDKVGGLTPEGGTNLEEAMRLAYETARRHYLASGMNRVVLITDGAANLGDVDTKDLKAKVETNRKQGIALDCFGIGWEDYNDNLLEQLSSQGDGRYAFLNTPEDAHDNFATKLAGALQIAASGVKVQVEFNPQRTIAYRQIGYATHQLTKQQFRDNTVAAGEIAAAEAGNALYTVETDPAGDGPIATVHVRYQIPGSIEYHEQSWDVPYTGRAVALDQASPAMRLAATSAAFSEWLASSPFAGEVTPDQLLNYLNGVPAVYSPDERPKKLEWMIRQAKSLTGK